MVRKVLYTTLPILLLVIFTLPVNAQNAATGNIQTATDAADKLKLQMQLVQEQRNTAKVKAKEEVKVRIQAEKDEFRQRLQTIKDLKKKALVERIDEKLTRVNTSRTARYTIALNRLQEFLDKTANAATGITPDEIAATQAAIDAAKTAVEDQAMKSYTMTIADDATLRLNVGTTVSQLRQDLMAVYNLVVNAKQSLQKLNARSMI